MCSSFLMCRFYMCSTHLNVSNLCHRVPAHLANFSFFFFITSPPVQVLLYPGKWQYNMYSLSTRNTLHGKVIVYLHM
ncbi:uncharacterized protein LACBIDRAFT_296653 [Laccaria bicolor S238N-H82]|uniref:Predicted protein n=1 Tax=Laccaria bicolor (strain S238N-H82 / ATCC MYA-4686) TaxID=486041 RepID=B0D9C3_LACBS|nr:uncharacterized protein LACBIDRAFT_296653 [Laccaria bicolor S238N-H82]EDR09222.1 predicted protein [Laccaria bicolor S238N-H82]|eukprot:XP_001880535.1 predicted protein [Laccaria bicolor S238N-H82]